MTVWLCSDLRVFLLPLSGGLLALSGAKAALEGTSGEHTEVKRSVEVHRHWGIF